MIKPSRSRLLSVILLIACIPCFWSCGNVRQLQYLQGQFDTAQLSKANYPEPVIQKNEIVTITVYSDDPRASAYYNLPPQTNNNATSATVGGAVTSSALTPGSSYLVDESGKIQFPGLGELEVAGLTKAQLYKLLQSKLGDKLTNPYFTIRLSSYKITMLGEVARPGQLLIPNERVSLLEAISLAGDLTTFGRRDNILVIREINGERTYGRLDVRKPEIFNSPFYYLQPNDIIIVDLTRGKAAASDQTTVRNISIATSVISVLAVVISLLR